jgi:hypothetical protein
MFVVSVRLHKPVLISRSIFLLNFQYNENARCFRMQARAERSPMRREDVSAPAHFAHFCFKHALLQYE